MPYPSVRTSQLGNGGRRDEPSPLVDPGFYTVQTYFGFWNGPADESLFFDFLGSGYLIVPGDAHPVENLLQEKNVFPGVLKTDDLGDL